MNRALAGSLLLVFTVMIAAPVNAGVVMCTDAVTGKKTFTDKGCATAGTGKKVKIQTTNFGSGQSDGPEKGTWNKDRDRSVAGRANLASQERRSQADYKTGYLPSGS